MSRHGVHACQPSSMLVLSTCKFGDLYQINHSLYHMHVSQHPQFVSYTCHGHASTWPVECGYVHACQFCIDISHQHDNVQSILPHVRNANVYIHVSICRYRSPHVHVNHSHVHTCQHPSNVFNPSSAYIYNVTCNYMSALHVTKYHPCCVDKQQKVWYMSACGLHVSVYM